MTSILVVDDNLINQKQLAERFKAFDHDIQVANNGEEALEFISENHVDMVFMDLYMPVLDGFEATKQLRVDYDFSELPIIGMLKESNEDLINQCFQCGMNDYIVKPFAVNRIEALIKQWLNVVSSSPAVVKSDALDITGISYINGLKRVMGKKDIYHELLHNYATRDEKILEALLSSRRSEDRDGVKYYAHALKGVSSNVGAVCIAELCKELEKELWEATWFVIDDVLNQITSAYKIVKEDILLKVIVHNETSATQNAEGIVDQLKALLPELSKGDIKACKKHVTMIKHMKWPNHIHDELDEMIDLVKRYHFKEAENIIHNILKDE